MAVTADCCVIVLAGTLACTPPPLRYDIVNVIFDGATPYVLLNRKLDGSYDVSILDRPSAFPIPTLMN